MSLVRPLPPPTYVRTLGRILTGKERRLKIGTGRVTRIGTGRVAGTGTGTRTYPWHGRALESMMILIWMRSQLFIFILCLSICLSVSLYVSLSLPLLICLPLCLSLSLSASISIPHSPYLPVPLPLSVPLCVDPSVLLFIYLLFCHILPVMSIINLLCSPSPQHLVWL